MNNDVYNRIVSKDSDGSNDIYMVGGTYEFKFPIGTPESVAYLAFAKQGKLIAFKNAIEEFAENAYDIKTKISLIALYLMAEKNALSNRIAYIAQALDWATSVVQYASQFEATVYSMTDADAIAALSWDFGQIPKDPQITLEGVVAIPN